MVGVHATPGARATTRLGSVVVVECPRCGEENADRARFCQACGSDLKATAAGREERKLVSALFVDLVGSTAWAERADPEEVREGLRLYHDRAKVEIETFGGTVEKFIGDAVVAIFGAPVAHGDDAELAVRAGLRVLDAIGELNAEHPGLQLEARAAVNTGEAIVSVEARPELGEAFATGDVLNTAARLQGAAPPGCLIVGAETYRATRRAIHYEPMSPIVVKGKRDPIEVWRAVEPLDHTENGSALKTPLVGRERELELLTTLWRQAVDEGRPHLVTVLGPPGIGKTRLSTEFASRIERGGGRAVSGRCLPYEERTGYHASGEHVKQIAGILESDPPEVARAKLDEAIAALLPPEEVAEIARYLSLLLGLGTDEPTEDRLPIFFAMRRVVEALGLGQPAVFIFEDLHWAGTSQLDLLDYLSSHVRDVPAVFLALSRPELADQRPTWGGGLLAHTTIPLEPLSPSETAAIAAHVLSGGSASAPAVERLVEAAGGNPLFAEELAASLAEGVDEDALPTTVREAIASRIDLLPADLRSTLLDASVIGKTFWLGMLQAIGATGHTAASLDALEARDLIRRVPRSQIEGEQEYAFKHILIREVAYGILPRAAKQQRHAGVARYIEDAIPGNIRELAWLLAHHWRGADDRDRAVTYLILAAERAREGWAKEEAVELFSDALELIGDTDPAKRTQVRLKRALGAVELSDFDIGAGELEEILPDLKGNDEFEATLALAISSNWLEREEECYRYAARVRVLAEQLDQPDLFGPAISASIAAQLLSGELDDAVASGQEALAAWVPGTRTVDLAVMQEFRSEAAYWVGDYELAEELAGAAHDLGSEAHSIEPLLRGGAWRGLSLAALGRTDDAITLLDSITERAVHIGNPRWGAPSLNYSSLPFRDLFMVAEARNRNEEALERVERHGEWGMPRMQGEIDLLLADLMDDEPGRVQERWPVLWDAAINGKSWRPWLGGLRLALIRAEVARRTDGADATVPLAHDVIERAIRRRRPKYEAEGRALLGSALIELDRTDEGLAELRAAVALAERLGSPPPRWKLSASLGEALYTVGDDDGAAAAFATAKQTLEGWSAELSAEHRAALFSAEPVRAVIQRAGS